MTSKRTEQIYEAMGNGPKVDYSGKNKFSHLHKRFQKIAYMDKESLMLAAYDLGLKKGRKQVLKEMKGGK